MQACQLLQGLGLGESCLALYLSSRIDLLPAEFCREFALTPDSGPLLSTSEVRQALEENFSSGSRAFAEFNFSPMQSTLLTQSHVAKLANGASVIVTFLRPECCGLRGEREVLPSINKDLVRRLCGPMMTEDVFQDFFAALRRKSDFAGQRETMELMAYDNGLCEAIRVRKTYHELSTNRIITSEQLGDMGVDEVLRKRSCNADSLARGLCQAWLYSALRGNGFAVDPQPHSITLLDNAALFSGCELIALHAGTKENLWNYLMATMVDDPDKAASYLLREMWPVQRANIDATTFRSKFRQSAYFGVLEPVLGTNANALAQLIFQHWKTALEYGYAPKPHLLCFYRGLFSIARIAHTLSPARDPLREGMEEVRAARILLQFWEIADWSYWFQKADKLATALVTMPAILDDALTQGLKGDQEHLPEWTAASAPNKRSPPAASRWALSLLLLAFMVLDLSSMSAWVDKLLPLGLMLGGLLVLEMMED
jgi:ubiquinone biosynthesis protein